MTFLVHATQPCFHDGSMRLTSALTCAALLMFGVAPADALSSLEEWWPLGLRRERWRGRCPRTCECWEPHSQFLPGMEDLESSDDDGYPVYNCGKVDVKTKDNHYVAITCKDVSDICDELPFIQLFSNDTIGRLLLYDCPVPETFSCLLAKLGAADADTVKIFAPRGELRVNNIEGLKKTTELHYTAANQSSVQYDVLRALPSLEYFRIKDAKLHLPADELSESDETGDSSAHPSLKRFELISNQIQEVPHGAFRRFKGLTRLYLADNPIRNIYNESFIGMESLEFLSLSKNPFKVLPPGVFAHTPRLKELLLRSTGLEEIPNGAITGLQMLETIKIARGRGLSFGSRALGDLPSLKKLNIENIIIKPVPSDLLQGDTKLQQLVISCAGLEELPKQFFNGLVNLEILNLNTNNITALDSDIFRPLKALKQLDLNRNRIEMLPSRLFEGLTRLLSFSANENHMKVIAPDTFWGADSLYEVSLTDNELTLTTDEDEDVKSGLTSPFAPLKFLDTLRLGGNHLQRVFADWFEMKPRGALRLLDLSRNRYTKLTVLAPHAHAHAHAHALTAPSPAIDSGRGAARVSTGVPSSKVEGRDQRTKNHF